MVPLRYRSTILILALTAFVVAPFALCAQSFGATSADLQGDDFEQAAREADKVPVDVNIEPVDAALVGVWELAFPDTDAAWKWVIRIQANGRYSLTTDGPGQLPGHSGAFQGAGGHWSLESNQGMAWVDGGTYSFPEGPDGKILSLVGKHGAGVWTRR